MLLQAPGFVAVLRGNAFVIELANPAFEALVGRNKLTGQAFAAAVPELASQPLMRQLEHVLKTGLPFAARETAVMVGGPGSEAQLHYIDFALQPIKPDGGEGGIFLSGVDVSAAHRAREALLLNEERLNEGLQAARMAVWDWPLGGEVAFSDSASGIFGASISELRRPWHLLHPEDAPKLLQARSRALEDRGSYQMTVRAHRADDGAMLWIEIRAKVICDESGHPQLLRGVTLDVTAREQAEQALRTAERRKDEFLAMLAHELRNPLAPISAAGQLLLAPQPEPKLVQRAAAIVARQSAHLARLVDDLLDAARISRGKVELLCTTFDFRSAVTDALEQLKPLAMRKQLSLVDTLPEAAVPVYGDRARLAQVVANLLSNATRFTPSGGRINVVLKTEGDVLELTVHDSGCGIAPELLPHVFDLFTQGQRGADRTQGGLGIGLAIVAGLVQLHGGSVTAHSDGAGKGACFAVKIPLATNLAPAPVELAIPGGEGQCVLVVDDNRDAADSLAMLLEAEGYRCIVIYDAMSVLAQWPTLQPDACILDIGLPGMDGYSLAREIRMRVGGRKVKLIALSGYARPEDHVASQAAGFDHHFAKPAALPTLLQALA